MLNFTLGSDVGNLSKIQLTNGKLIIKEEKQIRIYLSSLMSY